MVTMCLQCGDIGFSNALVYCVKCLEVPVHRYCLDVLPDTFDEFVHWVCEDCEVEVPQQFISLKSEPIQLKRRDYTNSKNVERSFREKSKKRKMGNLVLDSAEHICEGVPSEPSHKVGAEIKLTKSAQFAGECSLLEVKQKVCDGATPIAKTKDQIPPSSSSSQHDDTNNEVGSHHSQSPDDDDVPLKKMKTKKKKKKKKKKKDNSSKHSLEKFRQRLGYSPFERPCEALTENNLNDHDDSREFEKKEVSPSEAENNKNKKKNKESARHFLLSENVWKRIGCSPSKRTCELYTENNLNEHNEPTDSEKKRASPSEAKKESNGCRRSCEVNTELEVTVTGNQVLEFSLSNKFNNKKRVVYLLSADLPEQGPKTKQETPRSGPGHLSNNETLNNHELVQPLADPIWRGSFNILNKEYDAFDGLVAHLSKKACQKAYEEASLFPTMLDLKMHPKLDIWPKSFEKSEPSDDSIALYFFPIHKRYERMFDHLVEEMLDHELAMRAILKNAELLVFTSIELPLNYWRFQGKYYLWGVFRGKQHCSAQAMGNNHVGTKEGSNHAKAKSGDTGSPLSPLSKDSFGSGT